MDDERSIRVVVSAMLRQLGYDVEVANEGLEAIELFRAAKRNDNPFDLVIMDLTIPGHMGGKEAVAELRKLDQTIKTIVASGYSNDPILANYADYGFSGVLTKPFSMNELSHKVAEVLAK
jgi:CheY-like chemotaxis protein